MHVREQIRRAVKDLLDYSGKRNWKGVYSQRIQQSRDIGNYILSYIDTEAITVQTIHPGPLYARTIPMVTELRMRLQGVDFEKIEDKADDFCEEVEERLNQTSIRAVVPKVKLFALDSVTIEVDSDDPDRSYMLITLIHNVIIHTYDGQPSTLL